MFTLLEAKYLLTTITAALLLVTIMQNSGQDVISSILSELHGILLQFKT